MTDIRGSSNNLMTVSTVASAVVATDASSAAVVSPIRTQHCCFLPGAPRCHSHGHQVYRSVGVALKPV